MPTNCRARYSWVAEGYKQKVAVAYRDRKLQWHTQRQKTAVAHTETENCSVRRSAHRLD